MRKTFWLTSILLLSASWALAQASSGPDQNVTGTQGSSVPSQQGARMAPQGGTTSGRQMVFEGCLALEYGKFHLIDRLGTSYELTGKTANLKGHAGHMIAVTGKVTTSGENQPGAMSGEQGGMEQTLQVSSFRHVSGSCSSTAQ